MLSVPFGFEANLTNNGVNMGISFTRPVTILGIQADCSIMSQIATVGWSEVLFDCVAYQSGNIQGPPPHVYLGSAPNPDVVFGGFDDATGGTVQGGAGGQGRLFAAIAKMWAPSAAGRVINLTGLNIGLPANGQVLFHMDGAGVQCDAEMQGVIFYQ